MKAKNKEAAIERLAKAREARLKKNPPAYKQYAPNVVALPDDDMFSLKNVRSWIKEAKELKAAEHFNFKNNVKGALAKREQWNNYVSQCESYLRNGMWDSLFAGPRMEQKVKYICVAMAYHPDGRPKRELGVYYPDVAAEWTPERENEERESWGLKPLNYSESGAIIVDGGTKSKSKKKKTTRTRKPMTEAQKKAFVARMKKAREAKGK